MQVACHISLESYWQGLQLFFKPHLNRRSAQDVMGIQSHRSPNFGNFRTPKLGVLGQNDIWVQAVWPSTKNNIRGKVVVSPNLSRGVIVHQKCSNYALTYLLFGLCKFMWIIDPFVTHSSPHPGVLTRPYTFEVLQAKERTPTFYPSVVFTLDS
jgi:hypothetical protein